MLGYGDEDSVSEVEVKELGGEQDLEHSREESRGHLRFSVR